MIGLQYPIIKCRQELLATSSRSTNKLYINFVVHAFIPALRKYNIQKYINPLWTASRNPCIQMHVHCMHSPVNGNFAVDMLKNIYRIISTCQSLIFAL